MVESTGKSEIVLPSGRFAACREILVGDWLVAVASTDAVVILANRCVTIDNSALSLDDIFALPLADFWPIMNMIATQITRARLTESGVK